MKKDSICYHPDSMRKGIKIRDKNKKSQVRVIGFIIIFVILILSVLALTENTGEIQNQTGYGELENKLVGVPENITEIILPEENITEINKTIEDLNETIPENITEIILPEENITEIILPEENITEINKTIEDVNETQEELEPIKLIQIPNEVTIKIIDFITDSAEIIKGQLVKISAKLVYFNETPIPDKQLTFYTDETIIDTSFTNEFGEAEIFWNPNEIGDYTLKIMFEEDNLSISSEIKEIEVFETINNSNQTNQTVNQTNLTVQIINTTQGQAEINKPVEWTQEIQVTNSENNTKEIEINSITPEEAEISIVKEKIEESEELIVADSNEIEFQEKQENNTQDNTKEITFTDSLEANETKEYVIKYETPAPEKIETNETITEQTITKNITIKSNASIHYHNVLSYAEISEAKQEQVYLYWMINGSKVDVVNDERFNVSFYDENNNSLIDKISWIVPQLSEQNFVLEIILITTAIHLDENRTFISDIYEEVKELDNVWSETINNNEYVRITFERNLTNKNDITVYAREVSSGFNGSENARNATIASIEVYRENGNKTIAVIENINEENKYKTYLTGLEDGENYNTFDLKVIGQMIFDYIVDPTVAPDINFTSPTPDNGTTVKNTSIIINVSIENAGDLNETVYNWNGTNYTIYNDSLILFYNFDNVSDFGEGTGDNITVDLSNRGNNGTCINMSVIGCNYTTGKYGMGMDFNGINESSSSYVNVSNALDLSSMSNFTISSWVYLKSDGIDRTIVGQGSGSCSIELRYDGFYDQWYFNVRDTGWEYARFTQENVNLNQWYHLVGVYDADTIKIYVDGVLGDVTDSVVTICDTSASSVKIGKLDTGDFIRHWNGTIDEVMIWNKTLTSDEVYQLYASNLRKYDAANWSLYVNQSKNATDILLNTDYTYFVSAKDNTGNENKTRINLVTFSRDFINPDINFTLPTPANVSNQENTDIYVNYTVSDANDYYSFIDFNNDLLLWMTMNEVNGSQDPYDNSSYSKDGDLVGNAFINDTGKFGNGSWFDGDDDMINISVNDLTLDSNQSFSFSAWVYSIKADAGVESAIITSANSPILYLENDGSGNPQCGFRFYNGSFETFFEPTAFNRNEWHLCTATFNGSTKNASVYRDGAIRNSAIIPNGNLKDRFRIGESGASDFNGSIDEVLIFNRTLSENEVLALYNGSNTYKNFTDLSLGSYNFTAHAVDAYGNSNSTEKIEVIIDLTNPNINFTSPTLENATNTYNTSIIINVSIVEANLDEVIYNWNGINYTIYNDSLVLYLNFDNVSSLGESDTNNVTIDISGYVNNGICYNMSGGCNYTSGKYGNAVYFQGNGTTSNSRSYIELPNDNSVLNLTSNFSYGAWFKFAEDPTTWERVMAKGNNEQYEIWFSYDYDGIFCRVNDGAGIKDADIPHSYDGLWHHVFCVVNGTHVTLFFDGVYGTSTVLAEGILATSTDPLRIGEWGDLSNPRVFNGTIDEVMIWNRTLSYDEVYQIYVSNLQKFNSTQWYLYVNQSENATTDLARGNYTYFASAKDKLDNENQTRINTFELDPDIPSFSNYLDNNGSVINGSGVYAWFNVTLSSTNGTVWLEINNSNFSATNSSGDITIFNISILGLSNNTYVYRWHSWGNGSLDLYKASTNQSYTVLKGTSVSGCVNLTVPDITYTQISNIVQSSDADCILVQAADTTLDGNGYSVTSIYNRTGVYSDQSGTTIKNMNISMGSGGNTNSFGIELVAGADSSTIQHNLLNDNFYGLSIASDVNVVENNTINISNFGGNSIGIYIVSSMDNNIFNNTITSNLSHGIHFNGAQQSNLTSNVITTISGSGFYSEIASNSNILLNNTIKSNTSYGIYLNGVSFNTLTSNTVASVSNVGIFISSGSDLNNLINNTVISNTNAGIVLTGDFNNLTSNTARSGTGIGISLSGSTNNILYNNTGMSNTSTGISLVSSSVDNNLTLNTGTSNSSKGIYLAAANNNLTFNTGISNASYGIHIYLGTNNNILESNNGTSELSAGIYFDTAPNNNILNNSIGKSNSSYGIFLDTTSGNNLTSNTGISSFFPGIYLYLSSTNNLTLNTGMSNSSYGIYLWGSARNSLDSNNASSNSSNAFVLNWSSSDNNITFQRAEGYLEGSNGVYLINSSRNRFQDCVNISGIENDVYVFGDVSPSLGVHNTSFINCSYNTSKESVNGATNDITRKWYYQVYVGNIEGTAISGSNVSAHNSTGAVEFSVSTNSLGWINLTSITDYVNMGGTRYYYSNYIINSTSGSAVLNHSYNSTLEQSNITDLFTFDTKGPAISVVIPISNNTNSSNTGFNINYTVSDLTNVDSCWYSNDTMLVNTSLGTICSNITGIVWIEGQHNVTVWANDTLGNENSTGVSFTIDTTNPGLNITYPINNTNHTVNTIDVNYTIGDAIGVDSCWYSNDTMLVNTSLTTNCNNLTSIVWSDGQHNVTVYVNDTSNNLNYTSVSFLINTTENLRLISISTDRMTYSSGNTVNFSADFNSEGENVRLLIAENISFIACNYTEQSGCIANSSILTDSPANAIMTASVNTTWYAQICNSTYFCDKLIPDITIASDFNMSDANATLRGINKNDQAGIFVSSGDFNNDSIEDIFIGANWADNSPGNNNEGETYIVYGSSEGSSIANLSEANVTLRGINSTDYSGTCVASGDFNGDGIIDVIIGAYGADNPISEDDDDGAVYVVYGNSQGSSINNLTDANVTLRGRGISSFYYAGTYVDSGDFNNDTIDDLIIGAYGADNPPGNSAEGEVYIVYGSSEGFGGSNLTEANVTLKGINVLDSAGVSVASGDFNGDGVDDAIIGALGKNNPTTNGYAGEVYVVYGGSVGIPALNNLSDANVTLRGISISDYASRVSSGDFNGDGIDDVIIGAYLADNPTENNDEGEVYIVYGNSQGSSINNLSDANVTLRGINADDFAGYAVSSGDFNGDGIDDVIIGAYASNNPVGNSNEGETYIVYGSSEGSSIANLSEANVTLRGIDVDDLSGYSVSSGDFNGDGLDDVIIGAYGANNPAGGGGEGEVYVVYTGKNLAIGNFSIDSVNPSINISSPANNTNFSGTGLDIDYIVSDNLEVRDCWWSSDTYTVNNSLVSCENITNITWGAGQHNVTVWVNDSAGNKNSTGVSFNITIPEPPPTSATPAGGGGSSVIYRDLNIIVPGRIEISLDDSIIIPINIVNPRASTTLKGISLSAYSNTPNLRVEFDKNEINQLKINQNETVFLTLESGSIVGEYEINVRAVVSNPAFTEEAKIYVDLVEAVGKSGIVERIVFANDFFRQYSECLELNDLLIEAEIRLNKGDIEGAGKLVEDTISLCRDLISHTEKPFLSSERIKNWTGPVILTLAILVAVMVVIILFRRRGLNIYKKGKKMKKKNLFFKPKKVIRKRNKRNIWKE
ncbi:MAG: LamG-like jellyroll fold domain-containing protein [archaeon]